MTKIIIKMTYEQAKGIRAFRERESKDAASRLNAITGAGSGPMGLTPDHIRARPEWQVARKESSEKFEALRQFNSFFTKTFAKEYRAERKERGYTKAP